MPVTNSTTYTLKDAHNSEVVADQQDDGGTPMVAFTIGATTVFANADDAHEFAAGINFIADNLPTA